jgi:hypothetical protein
MGATRGRRWWLVMGVAALALGCGTTSEGGDASIDAGRDGGRRRRDAGQDAGPRCTPATGLPSPLACNGHAELCDRTFEAVAYATTHNAMSTEEDRWIAPNQGRSMWHQLEDGVRGMMLDVYDDDGVTTLCHGFCELGRRPLVDALVELRTFMDCYPAEVITLIFESYVSEARMAEAFEQAGLLPYLHAQSLDAPWPTLRAMIESGRRMVVFTQSADVTLPWHHHAYTYGWDNPYAAETPDDLRCHPNRGSGDNAIFILNHFLTAPIASPDLAEMINHDPFLTEQVRRCQEEAQQLPNFVTVDFYEIGDLFSVVDALNGL